MTDKQIRKMRAALELALKALEGYERKDVAIDAIRAVLADADKTK